MAKKKAASKKKSAPRKRKAATKKRRATRSTTTTTYPRRVVKRTTRANVAGLSQAETREIMTVGAGGAAAGAVAGMVKRNKPEFLKAVPNELIPGLIGIGLVLFGTKGNQGKMMRGLGTGMIAYSAGNYAENFVSQANIGGGTTAEIVGESLTGVGDLYVTGPDYSLPSVKVNPIHSVGDLVYSLQG